MSHAKLDTSKSTDYGYSGLLGEEITEECHSCLGYGYIDDEDGRRTCLDCRGDGAAPTPRETAEQITIRVLKAEVERLAKLCSIAGSAIQGENPGWSEELCMQSAAARALLARLEMPV